MFTPDAIEAPVVFLRHALATDLSQNFQRRHFLYSKCRVIIFNQIKSSSFNRVFLLQKDRTFQSLLIVSAAVSLCCVEAIKRFAMHAMHVRHSSKDYLPTDPWDQRTALKFVSKINK